MGLFGTASLIVVLGLFSLGMNIGFLYSSLQDETNVESVFDAIYHTLGAGMAAWLLLAFSADSFKFIGRKEKDKIHFSISASGITLQKTAWSITYTPWDILIILFMCIAAYFCLRAVYYVQRCIIRKIEAYADALPDED
ncbi:hypothetical protein MTO96_012194 [Rhipicephalus appendiculatus]